MMSSLYYVDSDDNNNDKFSRQKLSSLISSYLEPVDPSLAITRTFRLVLLLLLSNHINKAYDLLCILYKHKQNIVPSKQYKKNHPSLALEYFWQSHQTTHPRPEDAFEFDAMYCYGINVSTPRETVLARKQWGEYRDFCRTGWMFEHHKLREPRDVHVWRKTDDPAMIAMCCRLLAKKKDEGQYPSVARTEEALEAAQKLYAQPQTCITEWKFDGTEDCRIQIQIRHSSLLFRRLAVELAIRLGYLKTAADILSSQLRLDGFNHGGLLQEFLFLPGIYDVLPLLAERGKEGNPYFITTEDAEAMMKEIINTVELRAKEGRQWSLAPEKVSWRELLDRLAKGAWKVNHKEYRKNDVKCAEDILFPPATEKQIRRVEKRVGELPADFKEMVRIANGFHGGWHLFGGGISGIENIDFSYEHVGQWIDILESQGVDRNAEFEDEMLELQTGTEADTFHHYIIPHTMWKDMITTREVKEGEYRYWHWAYWQDSGISAFNSVRDWVASCVEEVEAMVERGEKVYNGDEMEDESDEDSDAEDENDNSKVNLAMHAEADPDNGSEDDSEDEFDSEDEADSSRVDLETHTEGNKLSVEKNVNENEQMKSDDNDDWEKINVNSEDRHVG